MLLLLSISVEQVNDKYITKFTILDSFAEEYSIKKKLLKKKLH